MGKTLHTPFEFSDAVPDGRRRFWKQILPVTTINYEGRKIKFDPSFHTDLAESFSGHAFDQVPIVFADARNGHNMDPRNFGGDVVKTEYRGEGKEGGTWALIEADRQAARAIKKNPRLGVSARIRQGIEKADGRSFKRGIEHVLLTMNPRVTGMSPWQAVDLSEEDTDPEVVDLTAYQYKEGKSMGTKTKARRRDETKIDLSALTDKQFQDLIDLAGSAVADDDAADDDAADDTADDVVDDDATDEGDDDDADDADDDSDTDLSDGVIRREEVSQFQQMRLNLAKRDWKQTRATYTLAGVPPFMLDLAEPVLSSPDEFTIDLADSDDGYDVREAMTKMLDGVKGIIDLTGELGLAIDLSVDDEQSDEADAFVEAWRKTYDS